jgi:ABC-2 type transport system permease protein
VTDRRAAWWGTTIASARLELRRWRRERVAVVCALALPVVMAALVSVALGSDLSEYSTDLAVVDHDHGAASDAFSQRVLDDPVVRDVAGSRVVDSEAAARNLLDRGDVGAVIVLPEGLTARLAGTGDGDAARIRVLRADDDPIAGDLAALLVDQFEIRAGATTLAQRAGNADAGKRWPLAVDVTAPGGAGLDAATHYGPSLGLFFVLVTMGFTASRLVADRQRGVVERLAAGPSSPSAVLVGRAAAALAIGGLSLVTLAVAMWLLFGESWGPALPVLAVTAAVVVALAGVAAVLAALARTPAQAQSLSVGVAFVFALASGSLAPPGAALRPAFAALVPTTHALDAYATITTERGGIGSVAVPLAVLCLFGLGAALLTPLVSRRLAR